MPDPGPTVRLAAPSLRGVVRLVAIVAACAIGLYLVWRTRGVLRLTAIALFVAMTLNPIVDALDRPRPSAAGGRRRRHRRRRGAQHGPPGPAAVARCPAPPPPSTPQRDVPPLRRPLPDHGQASARRARAAESASAGGGPAPARRELAGPAGRLRPRAEGQSDRHDPRRSGWRVA